MSKRHRWVIVAVVALALITVGVRIAPNLIHRQLLGLGAMDIHDAASLADHINVCGRDWRRDALDRRFTKAGVVAWSGREPTLVDPEPFAPCPSGVCSAVAKNGPCDTVVFVRVGEDSYLDYALQGGP
jgi:hypothetical protein